LEIKFIELSRVLKLKGKGFFYVESIGIIRVKDMPERRPEIYTYGNSLSLIGKNSVNSPKLV